MLPHPFSLSRYNLYVDCMVVEGVSDMDSAEVDGINCTTGQVTDKDTDR